MSLPVIGKLLGHSQPTTTARYAHLANDPIRTASNVNRERDQRGDEPHRIIARRSSNQIRE